MIGDEHRCPHCLGVQRDLWDYDWGEKEVMIAECSHCDRPIDIVRTVSVTYRVEAPESAQVSSPDKSDPSGGSDHGR